jgi:hypothetical protein
MGLALGMFRVDGFGCFGMSRVAGLCVGLCMSRVAGFGMSRVPGIDPVAGRFGMSLPAYEPCTFGAGLFFALGWRVLDAGFE